MPIYEELFYLRTGRYVDFMRSSLRRNLITQTDKLIYAEISGQTQEIVAGNDELARTFGKGFDATNRTLAWGFSNIADRLGEISSAIEDLAADFNYSIGLVIEQMQIQNNLLNKVIEKLDAIHKTLESPLLTQAREFYRIGTERLQRGLIDKALDAFLKAEEKNDADFFTEFQLGKLYLYGIDEDDNVIDLKKAQEHLRLADRYGKGELKVLPDFNRLVGEACFHTSVACYVSVNEPEIMENPSEIKRLLEEARNFAKESCEVYPKISEAYYHYAKFSALLGDSENAITNLEKAITMDRRYCIKAEIDKDFDAVRPEVIKLYETLRKESAIKARELLDQAKELLSKIHVYSEEGKQVKGEAEQLIQNAETLIEKNTYFSHLDAIPYLNKAIEISSLYFEELAWFNCELYKTIEENNYPPIVFSPDSKLLASTGYPEQIFIHDIEDGGVVRILESDMGSVQTLAFSTDGELLASGGFPRVNIRHGIVKTWNIKDGVLVWEKIMEDIVRTLAFSTDGELLASGCDNGVIEILNTKDGKLIRSLEGRNWVSSLAFSPDGELLASGCNEGVIEIWDTKDGKLIRSLEGSVERDEFSIAFSPDARFSARGKNDSREGKIRIWNVNKGNLITTLQLEKGLGVAKSTGPKPIISFSPNGKFLAVRCSNYSDMIKIWRKNY